MIGFAAERLMETGRQQEQQTSGRGTFVPLVFGPGEAFQSDWSEDCGLLPTGPQVNLRCCSTFSTTKATPQASSANQPGSSTSCQ